MTRYRVLTAYAGREPGDEFDADLGSNAERWALDNGLVEIVKPKSVKKKPEEEEDHDA